MDVYYYGPIPGRSRIEGIMITKILSRALRLIVPEYEPVESAHCVSFGVLSCR
jgi:hypothetical protein